MNSFKMQISFLVTLSLVFSPTLMAAETSNSTPSNQGQVVPATNTSGAQNAAANQGKDSNKGSSGNSAMAGMHFALSAGFAAAFAASCSGAGATCVYPLLAASLLMAVRGGQNKKQAGAHKSNGSNSFGSAGDFNQATQSGGSGLNNDSDFDNEKLNTLQKNMLNRLKSAGVTLENGKAKFGDKTIDLNSLETLSGFTNAGGSAEQFAMLNKKSADIEKKVMDRLGLLENVGAEGELAGGKGKDSTIVQTEEDGLGNGSYTYGKNKDRDPSSVAGLSKDYNGDRIGVAADNIFLMVNRRYIARDKANSFISNDLFAPPPALSTKN